VRLERVRVRRAVIVGAPLVEVVGNVVAPRIGRGVFEIDYNVFMVLWRVEDGVFEQEEVAVLRVVVSWSVSAIWCSL
jgi:hypothetical protein